MKIIIGRKPVLEALKSDIPLEKIYFAQGIKGEIISEIKSRAKQKKVIAGEVSFQKIKDFEKGQNSQGVVAIISSYQNKSLEELIFSAKKSTNPLLLILDTVQDPHNVGAILRTAECAGVDGVILTSHQSSPLNETVEKTAAGAVSHLNICTVNNLSSALKELKKEGFWIFGSSLANSKPYKELDYSLPVALIVGNEEKGIRKLTAQNCDFLVHIPMKGKLQSLNVSVAAGVLLFGILAVRESCC